VIDDCSTDGTRQNPGKTWPHGNRAGTLSANANDGDDPIELRRSPIFLSVAEPRQRARVAPRLCGDYGEFVMVQDADLKTTPRLSEVAGAILDGRADVVFGSRFLGGPQRVHYFWHYVANKIPDTALWTSSPT